MKSGIFTSSIILLLFTACTKEDMAVSLADTQKSNTPFVSKWEKAGSNWQSTQSEGIVTYTHKRATPQMTGEIMNDGYVTVYTRGYTGGDMTMSKPTGMPFLFYGSDQQAAPYAWEIVKGNQRIDVMVKMAIPQQEQFVQGQNGVEFRYMVVPREFILKHSLSTAQMAKMSYQQLADLLEFEK